jgi:hypothetical protein
MTELDRELRGQPAPIPPPTLERMGAGYRAVWPDQRVEIVIPRVHWHKEDCVAVYAISLLPVSPGQAARRLDHGTLNLVSSRTRVTLAKDLGERWPADWRGILEQLCWAIQQQETQGEEPIELRTVDPGEDGAQRLLGDLCLTRSPSMIFGHGGDFKSYIAMAAALSINSGKPLLGMEPRERLRVAYCDWEWDKTEHRQRLGRLMDERDWPDMLYFPCRHPLSLEVDRLGYQFQKYGVGYMIVDSVSWACGGAPEESVLATNFMNALRQLGVGALCVAHVNRSTNTQMPFGSSFWHNGMRSTWYAKREQEPGDRRLTVGLWNRKANGSGLARPMSLAVEFSEQGTRVQITQVASQRAAEIAEAAGIASTKDRIILALRQAHGRAMTYEELSDQLDISTSTISVTVRKAPQAFTLLDPEPGKRAARVALTEQQPVQDQLPASGEPEQPPEVADEPDYESIRCPGCNGDEYQPLGAGRRKCLTCERVWEAR